VKKVTSKFLHSAIVVTKDATFLCGRASAEIQVDIKIERASVSVLQGWDLVLYALTKVKDGIITMETCHTTVANIPPGKKVKWITGQNGGHGFEGEVGFHELWTNHLRNFDP